MNLDDELGTIRIRGKQWSYGYGDPGITKGLPDDGAYQPSKRRIILRRGARTPLLELVAHEVAHAYFPEARETTITKFAEAFTEVYTRFSNERTT